ncbi:MAG: hypothetical protein OEV61_12355 [Chloroflexota bacterium]|jgi:Fe-S cluster assembly iron-binding protein IscA|nr:hypothetical protein [Chloroflexota bacterium]MDH5243129.1 hypothetical protein [Chloroflexota bacterium]
MLRLTSQATDHLLKVRRERGFDANAIPRFIRRTGRLALTFAKGPESGDRVIDNGRVSTLVAASASDLLDDALIDVKTSSGRSMLVVRRPREQVEKPIGRRQSSAGATG